MTQTSVGGVSFPTGVFFLLLSVPSWNIGLALCSQFDLFQVEGSLSSSVRSSACSSLVGTIATAINRPSDAAAAAAAKGGRWRWAQSGGPIFAWARLGRGRERARAGEPPIPIFGLAGGGGGRTDREEGEEEASHHSWIRREERTGSRFDAAEPPTPACLKSICSG